MNTHPHTPTPAIDPLTVRNFIGPGSAPVSTHHPPAHTQSALSSPPAMPDVGTEFLGFRLIQELGRGAFGRVYLATQRELAGRPVALKVSLDVTGESVSLAQLQHTNIVPVYSVHHDRGLHAVCMPYFGRTTLADLLRRGRDRRPASGADLADTLRRLTVVRPPPPAVDAPPPLPQPTAAVFDRLVGLTFAQAVCWMIARVADGLAHAHDRGIVHRDVKPANVLITDDGQPMLLDFGMAADLKARAAVDAAGGTIPYMAPEQLAGLFAESATADPRSDVYAVGVLLFEWLSGGHPFSPPVGDLEADLPRLVDERRSWVPWAAGRTADIPPDLTAIVRKCVAADPASRYQSAADLGEDLRRFLASEPLKVAVEPSGWHRLLKWRKRHPKLGGQLFVAACVLVALGLSVAVTFAWKQLEKAEADQARRAADTAREHERIEATGRLTGLQSEVRTARYRLAGRVNELRATPADLTRLREAVGEYGLPDDADWRDRPAVAALSDQSRVELFATLSDACLLLARGELQNNNDRSRGAGAATGWNTLAQAIRPGPTPRAVYSQRAVVFTHLGQPDEARVASELAASTPLLTAEDHFLSAEELLATHRYADALPLLREAVRMDVTHFWAQFQLGVCHHNLGRPAEARACYSAAIALRPTFAGAFFNRAVATVPLQDHAEVISDLSVVLQLEPDNAPARLHRAHALVQSGDRAKAITDLDAVLAADDPGGMHLRALFQRARWKKQTGDANGAAADTAAALRLTPADEVGWLLRGLARADADPNAALDDIRQAVRLNPQYVTALRNQVYVLEKLKRYEEAAEVMDRAVPLAPNDPVLLSSRGLLLARLGNAERAVKDITTALAKDRSTHTRMVAATSYALLCKDHPAWKGEVIQLLEELVKAGHNLNGLRNDPDFATLADDPDFLRLTGGE